MATTNDQAKFGIKLDSNIEEVAKLSSLSLESLRDRVQAGTQSIREMNADLKRLTGTSDEVSNARNNLKAAIAAEKSVLAAATVESYKNADGLKAIKVASEAAKAESLATQAAEKKASEAAKSASLAKLEAEKKAKAQTESNAKALAVSDARYLGLAGKVRKFKDELEQSATDGTLAKVALLGVAAAIVAVTAATVAGVLSLAKWVITAADGARSARLFREAAVGGNAEWGKNFGEQVIALSKEVPQSREQLDKLGASLFEGRVSGKTWVDSMHAISSATAALGDSAGGKLEEFITRGAQFQRFRLDPLEMIGSGVGFKEVAASLATSMKTSVKDAERALFEGRLPLAVGAKALRDTVEKKFGAINAAKMLSLPVLAEKFKDTISDLASGVNLNPILTSLKSIADTFSLSTESGQALKQLVTVFGKELGATFTGATPLVTDFIFTAIEGAQSLTIAYLKVRNALRDMVKGSFLERFDVLGASMKIVKLAALGVESSLAGVAVIATTIVGAVTLAAEALSRLEDAFTNVTRAIGLSSSGPGGAIAEQAGQTLGDRMKSGFKDALGIHSPSRVFAEYGTQTAEGYSRGVDRSAGDAQSSVESMVTTPSRGALAAGGATSTTTGGPISIIVNIEAPTGGTGSPAMSSPAFLESMTRALVDALRTAGVPVPA